MPHRNRDASPPSWLWFFLALPIGLIAVLVWQRRRVQTLLRRRVTIIRRPRYVEPDSIPIDTRPAYDMSEMEEAYQSEHAFDISEASLPPVKGQFIQDTPQVEPEKVDDLCLIEGIGPKIAALLNEHGIVTFKQLSTASLEVLDTILISANLRQIANPATWAEQADLAAAGDYEGLKQLQSNLKAGRREE